MLSSRYYWVHIWLIIYIFNKAKEGTKAIHLSYEDRNMMNVLNKQVHYCKFDEEKSKVGFLDLVGKDRL